MRPSGRIVILNGASSSGKTSVAAGLSSRRADRGELWLVVGIDDYFAKLPASWFEGGEIAGPFADQGVRFRTTQAGEILVELGPGGARLLAAYRRSAVAAARAGLDVLVDDVVIDEAAWRDWIDALAGLDAVWVAVRCSPEVLARREAERGDRFIGLARTQTKQVHRFPHYAIEIDTTDTSADESVDELDRALTDLWT